MSIDAMLEGKITYLKKYRISAAKLSRIRQMIVDFPEDAERYNLMLEDASKMRKNIELSIENVDGGGILSEILSQKYICGKSLEEIGYCLGYSKRQTERLHLKALKILTAL